MASRKEHLEKADDLLERAEWAERAGSHEAARRNRAAAQAHTQLAEAMRSARPTFGTTRQQRGRH